MQEIEDQSALVKGQRGEPRYNTDFYAWTQQQALLLQSGQWNDIDVPNLVEEIASLGKQQRREMRSRLAVLLAHLLKWEYQPEKRSRSWLATIRVQRRDLLEWLQESPSLKPYLEEAVQSAYVNARDLAMGETELPENTFPDAVTYSWAQIIDTQFFPGKDCELV